VPNKITTPSDFGLRLRERRRELGLTQEELADTIGVQRRVVGDMERGKPTLQLRIALAATRALGLDIQLARRDR